MFDLKRPCTNCPFRKGVGETFQMSRSRLLEIKQAVAFQCHKTVDYNNWDDKNKRAGDRPQQCAGLMAVLHREGRPNQIMQVGERFGALDHMALDPRCEAYASWAAVIAAHAR